MKENHLFEFIRLLNSYNNLLETKFHFFLFDHKINDCANIERLQQANILISNLIEEWPVGSVVFGLIFCKAFVNFNAVFVYVRDIESVRVAKRDRKKQRKKNINAMTVERFSSRIISVAPNRMEIMGTNTIL